MSVVRFLGQLLMALLGAVAGSVVGGQLRALLQGEPEPAAYRLLHERPDGETMLAVKPVFTNVLPGLLAALAGRPRWLWAFLASLAIAVALGDRLEERLLALAHLQPPPLELRTPEAASLKEPGEAKAA